jgi:hypothetical protein
MHDDPAIALFDTLVLLPPSDRKAFIRAKCRGNEALARRARELVEAHERRVRGESPPPPIRTKGTQGGADLVI